MRKNKIRILHVAQAAGGVDRYIRMLLKYLDKEKFENILVCSQDFHEEDYRDLVDSFEQVEMTRAIGGNDLKAIKEVRTLIKKYNPDIVYAHSSKAGAIARVADIGLKNHCVYNPHGWAFNMRCSAKKKAMYTAIEKVAAPFCDKIICISDAEKQSALDKKICREDKLQVIFNGVDIESYENGVHGAVKRKDLNIPEDAFVVGMVGRMSPQKAPDVFVKMAKQVKDTVPNAHFIIVGTGNQEAEIRKYAKDNGFSDSLHITGWVDNPMSYVELFDTSVETIEELKRFRNSKYVQSRVGYAFRQVKNELKKGRMVCFSGTPCQIEGLRHFLGKDYQNLILVDVVCRAVPSPGVWEKYIQYEVEQKGKLSSIRFRDKSLGYQYSTMELRAENGKKYRGGIESQPWLRMFFSGMIIRPSCTDCRFRSRYRNSDFTIWDCFPSYKYDKSFDERKGTTRVLIHSEKGKKLFANIKNCFKYCEVSSDDVVQNVTEMVESPTFHSKRVEFFSEFRILEMPLLIQKYFPITLKLELKKYVRLGLNLVGLDRIIKRYIRK